jgi:hypothetical protein
MFAKFVLVATALALLMTAGCSSDEPKNLEATVSIVPATATAVSLTNTPVAEASSVVTQPSQVPAREETSTAPVVPTIPTEPTAVSGYLVHESIIATIFWVGEPASADNDFIANDISAWDEAWVDHFGGVDDPKTRNGFHPAGFTPKENPFYCALPYGDYTETGPKANVTAIYWYEPFADGESLLKNQWIKVSNATGTAYCQWEDVGPFQDDDLGYVFGTARPIEAVGIDLSPAMGDFLRLGGRGPVSWQFVDDSEVPDGPWREIVTSRGPYWP